MCFPVPLVFMGWKPVLQPPLKGAAGLRGGGAKLDVAQCESIGA